MNTITDCARAHATPHSKKTYRAYLDRLLAQLERDPGRMFLLHAIMRFNWSDTPRETGDDPEIDHDFWRRHWNMREKARRVIQGVEPWPREFMPWKTARENRYYIGSGKRPPWVDAPEAIRDTTKSKLADVRRERRAKIRKARR